MRLHQSTTPAGVIGAYLSRGRHCPGCGEHVIAPEMSEFIDGGEIRHHWLCESCARVFCTAVETRAFAPAE